MPGYHCSAAAPMSFEDTGGMRGRTSEAVGIETVGGLRARYRYRTEFFECFVGNSKTQLFLARIKGRGMPVVPFCKYHGLGNDFIIVDGREQDDAWAQKLVECVERICDRRVGVGADGLILALQPKAGGDIRMRIINSNGSEAEMCGNGIRCLAAYLGKVDREHYGTIQSTERRVETLAGFITTHLLSNGCVKVDMGEPHLKPEDVPTLLGAKKGMAVMEEIKYEDNGEQHTVCACALSMGNPHAAIKVDRVDDVDVERVGPLIEVHPVFPKRANVLFTEVRSPEHLVLRVWERGAGLTPACGTGACAAAVAMHLAGLCERSVTVSLPGGDLQIEWEQKSNSVIMTGPATRVFRGEYEY